MAKKNKFRISTRYKEIFSVITGAKRGKENFLWKLSKNKRSIFPITMGRIEGEQNRMEVKLTNFTPELNKGDEVYLKLDSRDSAFKTQVLERLGPMVVLSFPDEMVLNENRESERHYFHPVDEKFILAKRVRNLVSSYQERSFSLLVSDVSETGLCVFVSQAAHQNFLIKEKIQIEMLGAFRPAKPLIGEIVFKMAHELKGALGKEPGFKLGIQLDSKIPELLLDRFLLKKTLMTLTEKQIVRDEAFRRKVQGSLGLLKKNLGKRRNFKDLFESLDKPENQNQYLKQHIHMLCEVACGLGTKLGWLSDKSIDKIIYVAYLHDIRFINQPKLARIQSKKEFEKIREHLTITEQRAYLEAPMYAAELARQDGEAFPDAIKILQQQKELPDGTGFPHGSTARDLAPLSCLFIFSHYFVDYVIDHPDWSVSDFQKTYQKKLKGPHFLKIFQAMQE